MINEQALGAAGARSTRRAEPRTAATESTRAKRFVRAPDPHTRMILDDVRWHNRATGSDRPERLPASRRRRARSGRRALLALEDLLVTEARPELHDEPPAVQIAVEVQEVGLDPALGAAVVRVRPDRDRSAMLERLARVDPVARPASCGSIAMFAVGYPSVPPRWSPATTVPSSSKGRPSIRAAPSRSPSRTACGSRSRRRPRPRHRRAPPVRAPRGSRGSRSACGRSGSPLRPRPPPPR